MRLTSSLLPFTISLEAYTLSLVADYRENDVQTQADAASARPTLAVVFNPAGPVSHSDLFQGRRGQIERILSAVGQHGQHVILFGERGVGKTSLASLTHEFWASYAREATGFLALRYNCDPDDTFGTIWARIAELLADEYARQGRPRPTGDTWEDLYAEVTHEAGTPHSVRRLLDLTGEMLIIVVDEFDQVLDDATVQQFASLIKALSDYLAPSTLILVGVADTVDDLIEDHASINRATIQVALPRMSQRELRDIIQSRYDRAGLLASPEVLGRMAWLAQGLPHYAHRLGQEAGFSAVNRSTLTVTEDDVDRAVRVAVEHSHESIRMAYRNATASPQPQALFETVLLASALTPADELGYFAPADVRGTLRRLTGRSYDYPHFVRHLKQFASPERGEVLEVIGQSRKWRYRFADPLLRPYVVLSALADGTLDFPTLYELDPQEEEDDDDGQPRLL